MAEAIKTHGELVSILIAECFEKVRKFSELVQSFRKNNNDFTFT